MLKITKLYTLKDEFYDAWTVSQYKKLSRKKKTDEQSNPNLLSAFNNVVVLRPHPKIFNPFQNQKITIPEFQLKQVSSAALPRHPLLSESGAHAPTF